MNRRSTRAAGFTLVELVVAIVVAALVASLLVLFLDAPVQSYFAQTRRSDLVDSANRIADAFTADVRTALPNSLRRAVAGPSKALELLATEGMARYYGAGDKNGALNGGLKEELSIGTPGRSFGTLDAFSTGTVPPARYLSIGNLGTSSPPIYDAYNRGNGVITRAGVAINVGPNPSTPPFASGENFVTLGANTTFQAPGAPATQPSVHNAYLVSGPVSYVCNPNPRNPSAGTLVRYSGYAITTGQAVPPRRAVSALIAHDVSACTLSFGVPNAQYGQLAILTVTLSSGGESLQVFLEARTEYVQ
ncbi:MAG TPA: prepilin-type N-terminal cleavage/methylation domain-containing protein [Steroidobacteraceae bacterium]|nr:prepilin-type N-terminal cleavage/methylation domain-containing protein [Steroidobacteraceae bacterium]